MKKHHLPTAGSMLRGTLGTVALTAALLCASHGSAQAAGTAASATITNMVKVEYLDAGGKGVDGTTTPITRSASTVVTVNLLAATPSIGAPAPGATATADSGTLQTFTFKVWSNANGIDTYSFDVSTLTSLSNATSYDRYISGVTNATGTTSTSGTGTTSVNLTIGAVTILSNTASSVTIPYGTDIANHIVANDVVMINGTEYKVTSISGGSPAAYSSANNTLTPETPTTVNLIAAGGGAANISGSLAGLTMSEEFTVAVSVTATADPNQAKATACFTDTMTSVTDTGKTYTNTNSCTDFTSSNLAISKTANPANGKPGDIIEYTVDVTLTGAKATSVKVTDSVPAYTTLVTYTNNYGGTVETGTPAATDSFALVSPDSGSTSYSLTVGNGDTEGGVGAGDVQANGPNGSLKDMTFYLGTGATYNTGGAVDSTQHFVLKYKVKIN